MTRQKRGCEGGGRYFLVQTSPIYNLTVRSNKYQFYAYIALVQPIDTKWYYSITLGGDIRYLNSTQLFVAILKYIMFGTIEIIISE